MATPDIVPLSLAEESYGRSAASVRRLAVFGPRGSGKTCFFASLYGHSSDDTAAVTFHDPSTEAYLRDKCWAGYRSPQGFPAPTAKDTPERLLFDVAAERAGWGLEILDHAGVLAERQVDGQSDDQLRQLFHDWLRGCEGVMVFLDTGTDVSNDALERRDAVARLLDLLRQEGEGRQIVRPLVLALTKWDEHGDTSPEAVTRYLRENPQFRQIWQTFQRFGKRAQVFPVSALGTNRVFREYPTDPFNLLPPLVWLLEQADEVRFEAAEREAAKLRRRPDQAAQVFQRLIDDAQITAGPVYEQLVARRDELLGAHRGKVGRRVMAAVAAVAAVVLFAGLGWRGWAASQYTTYAAFCDSDEGKGPSMAGQRADMADALLSTHSTVLSGEKCDRLRSDSVRDRQAERDHKEFVAWNPIKTDWAAADGMDLPQLRVALPKLEQDLTAFGRDHGGRKVGQEWEAMLRTVQDRTGKLEAQFADFANLQEEEKRLAVARDHAAAVHMWENYLKKRPPEVFAGPAREGLDRCKGRADNDAIRLLKADTAGERFNVERCGKHLDAVDQTRGKLYDPTRHQNDLDGIVQAALQDADQMAYVEAQAVLKDAKSGCKTAKLLEARDKIEQYLVNRVVRPGHIRIPRMAAEARAARDWLDKFAEGQEYTLRYDTLFVEKGVNVYSTRYGYAVILEAAAVDNARVRGLSDVAKTITATERDRAGLKADLSTIPNDRPVKMFYKPGQKDGLNIHVLVGGFLGDAKYDHSNITYPEYFMPGHLVAGVEFYNGDKKLFIFKMKCDDAVIPELPNYRPAR